MRGWSPWAGFMGASVVGSCRRTPAGAQPADEP
ncbi:hypothetical protein IW248_002967 [Micromonospora ureilytica]|uniref:Uncharacterized protein n=1 Tax=Micromonospora ureilytica TaxID=709868 RepID=A0ABS0JHY6_9ACTN|nr:hypothetical protein [Micromonospora ureilytica]